MELKTMSELEFLIYARIGVNIEIKILCDDFLSNGASELHLDTFFTLIARRNEVSRKIDELLEKNSQEELS